MNAGIISNRYAKAIFQYATERNDEDLLRDELKFLSKQFLAQPLLQRTLEDPTIAPAVKIDVLNTAAGREISATCLNVIRMIVQNKRARHIHSIALMYDKVYRKSKDMVIMRLVTTEPAGDEVKTRLVDLVKRNHDQVEFMTETDPDLIGGFIVQIDDLRLDASVRNLLKKLRRELIHT